MLAIVQVASVVVPPVALQSTEPDQETVEPGFAVAVNVMEAVPKSSVARPILADG